MRWSRFACVLVRFFRRDVVACLAVALTCVCSCAYAGDAPAFGPPEGGERVCLSLRVLSGRVSTAIASKSPLPEDCLNLAGMGFLEGFIVDDAGDGDLILVGLRSERRPSLRLDDLVVGMRSLDESGEHPYCSLDPRPEDIRAQRALFAEAQGAGSPAELKAFFERLQSAVGPQQVVVGGVPRDSRFARVMIDADYHMKKVSQGHVSLDGVTSYLDRSLDAARESILSGRAAASPASSMARFWFHVAPENPTFHQGKGIVWLDKCALVVLTEKQMATTTGELVDVDEDDPTAAAFAGELSASFSAQAQSVPVYADLENLFRLRALLLAMEFRNSLFAAGLDSHSFLRGYRYRDENPMEESLPGLANSREWSHSVSVGNMIQEYYLFPMVCGGVGMDMELRRSSFNSRQSATLASLRTAALLARPSTASLSWAFPTGS